MNNIEIKFRAWNSIHNRMEQVHTMAISKEGAKHLWRADDGNNRYDNFNLMQYVWVKDRFCGDVYEGDIVSLCTYSNYEPINVYEGQVILGIYGIGIIGSDEVGENGCFWLREIEGSINHWEILGNIYEHPHLLEVQK